MTIGRIIWRNICGEMARQSVSRQEMMDAMRISKLTFYRRQEDPNSLTVAEINQAARLLGVHITDFMKEKK